MIEFEDLMTDPALQPDTIQRALKANDTAYKLQKITDSLDNTLERMAFDVPGNSRCVPENDLNAFEKRQRLRKSFESFIPVGERDILKKGWYGKAYRVVEKNFDRLGVNVTAAMNEMAALFDEYLSADEQEKVRKAVAALDVGLFLQFGAVAMKRSQSVAV